MSTNFDPRANYELTKQQAGYVERKKATQEDYDRRAQESHTGRL